LIPSAAICCTLRARFEQFLSDGMDYGTRAQNAMSAAIDALSIERGEVLLEWGCCVGHGCVSALHVLGARHPPARHRRRMCVCAAAGCDGLSDTAAVLRVTKLNGCRCTVYVSAQSKSGLNRSSFRATVRTRGKLPSRPRSRKLRS
jgi:hypothetical protein